MGCPAILAGLAILLSSFMENAQAVFAARIVMSWTKSRSGIRISLAWRQATPSRLKCKESCRALLPKAHSLTGKPLILQKRSTRGNEKRFRRDYFRLDGD